MDLLPLIGKIGSYWKSLRLIKASIPLLEVLVNSLGKGTTMTYTRENEHQKLKNNERLKGV